MSEQARVKIVCPTCGAPLPPAAASVAVRCDACGQTSAPAPAAATVVIERVVTAPASGAPGAPAARTPLCPRCTTALVEAVVHGAKLLGCGNCGGIFLDNAGCSSITRAPDAEIAQLAVQAAQHAAARAVDTRPAGLACPLCALPMQRTFVRDLVELDACPAHGTWFDRAELFHVIRLYDPAARTKPNPSEIAMAAFREQQIAHIDRLEDESIGAGVFAGIGVGLLGVLGALASGGSRS
jgi:Zn-finger nucleic acid-binding protein